MSADSVHHRFVLVRHGAIASQWKGICYGSQDIPLCEHWIAAADSLVCQLALLRPTMVFHSGLSRSKWLADRVWASVNQQWHSCELLEDLRLRERNFGDWEGKSWDDVYASDPDNFHGLIDKPDTYRPPRGETTNELQRRMVQWYEAVDLLGSSRPQTVIAITHSGPIAALAGHLLSLTPEHWSPWMLAYGEVVTIRRQAIGNSVGNSVEIQKGWAKS
jgi:broad specificity phosphatase PhoE